jgi:hypothetical protein
MFRSMSRTATVAVVALMLVLVSVPAAHALSFGSSGPSLDAGSGWFDAALSWLSQVLFGQPSVAQQVTPTFEAVTSTTTSYSQPLVGSCIDPEGGKPCL